MRASIFFCVLGLVICAIPVAPACAASDDDKEYKDDVSKKLTAEVQHLTVQGYRRSSPPRVEIVGRRKNKVFPLEFKAATTYAVIAVCDNDCAHVQISLRSPQGTVLARSSDANHTVIVGGSAEMRGRHIAEVSVPGCREEECYVGLVLLEQTPAEQVTGAARVASYETTAPAPYTVFDNYDLVEGDLVRHQDVDAAACALACSRDTRCVAYSYDKWNRWCFLKEAARAFRLEPNTISGLRQGVHAPSQVETPAMMQRYRNKAFPAQGGQARRAATFEECEERCRQDAQCNALTFVRGNSQCLLMETTGEYFPNSGADSAVKRQPPT